MIEVVKQHQMISNVFVCSYNQKKFVSSLFAFASSFFKNLYKVVLQVICDRFFDSTRVYQTVNKSKLTTFVEQLHELVIGFKPDLTFLIDMDPSVALARGLARNSNEDRFEGLGLAFQEKVRRGFIKFANIEKERYIIIDGDDSEEAISNQVFTKYKRFFKE